MTKVWGVVAALALAGAGCDSQGDVKNGGSGEGDESLSIAGFTLTGDDESDDGFTDGTDYQALLDELDVDGEPDPGEVPPADEVDPEPMPGDGPDRLARAVLITWGQMRLNPELAGTPTAWAGQVRTDVGAMKVMRTIRFERGPDGTDHLVRDEDPKTVGFETITTVHHDGVLVRLVLPRDPALLAGDFHFETEHFTVSVPLARIVLGGEKTFAADELGNAVTITSQLPHRCPHGLLGIRWERRGERGGVFGGRFYGRDGEHAGYVVGLWGVVDGRPRMKGAVLSTDYDYRGTLKGVWAPFGRPERSERPDAEATEGAGEAPPMVGGGTFHARWLGPERRLIGVIGGLFQVGDEPGEGTARGFWRLACDGERAECGAGPMPPAPPTASCECEGEGCECEARPAPECVPPEAPPADGPEAPPADGPEAPAAE